VAALIRNAGAEPAVPGAGEDLRAEAVRLARVVVSRLPDVPEATGLLALLLLTESRFRSRTAADGSLVMLRDQDRSRWDRVLIAEGHALVRDCLRRDRPGPFQLQAAVNAVHTDARSFASTDWTQILTLYDQLLTLAAAAYEAASALGPEPGPAGLPEGTGGRAPEVL
jgi:RNA polymerase sigma-70 factor, ECF subfamily